MNVHALLCAMIAATYLEGCVHYLFRKQYHSALRELAISLLYGSIALALLEPPMQ